MSRFRRLDSRSSRAGWRHAQGFTLLEMLVASAILVIMGALLVSITDTAGKVYLLSQSQNAYRLRARAVLDYIGRDLKNASLAVNQAVAKSNSQASLQFLIDPSGVTDTYADSIFWQAPIATDGGVQGDMAEVGYFVHWTAGEADLCRFFVNPSDTANYLIYNFSDQANGNWVTQSLLQTVAPSDGGADHYKGLFLQNVLGLWVQAYNADGSLLVPAHGSYNSFQFPYTASYTATPPVHSLPAYVIISIAVLDGPSAARLKQGNSSNAPPSSLSSLYNSYDNAADFVAQVQGTQSLAYLRAGITAATLKVSLNNYK